MAAAHEALVEAQFGPRARAYVESADHATGADLAHLAALVATRPGCRVLDLGCGGGHVSYAVAPHAAEVVACDLSSDMLATVAAEAAVRGLATIVTRRAIAEALPFPDAAFDFVFTRFSAHHWHDLPAGLAELRRVLRPDGIAAVVDTVAPEEHPLFDTFLQTIELLRDPSHVRDRTPAQWLEMLSEAGFTPAAPVMARLRLVFDRWVERIGTPDLQARAIRAIQAQMPQEVHERFAIEADGSFTIDTALFQATIASS